MTQYTIFFQDSFFTCGYCPGSLPVSASTTTPVLPSTPGLYKTQGYNLSSRLSSSMVNLDAKKSSPKLGSKVGYVISSFYLLVKCPIYYYDTYLPK